MRQCKWLAQTLPTCSRLRAFHPGKDANRRLESAHIAAIRELLDRRYGRAGQTPEVIRPENDIIQTMLDTSTAVIGSLSVRKRFVGTEVRRTGDDYALRRPWFPPAAPVEKVSERSDVGIESPGIVPDPGICGGNSDLIVRSTRYEALDSGSAARGRYCRSADHRSGVMTINGRLHLELLRHRLHSSGLTLQQ